MLNRISNDAVEKLKGVPGVYPASVHTAGDTTVAMLDEGERDVLIVLGDSAAFTGQAAVLDGLACLKAPLSHENAVALRRLFPFCAPCRMLKRDFTFGTGDRLGIATPGHIRVFEEMPGTPVLAQQSIRELNLTGRTYANVLDDASFAVYTADFQKGYGADGDHLKNPQEVEYALMCGYTMITLDCSEHINNSVEAMTDAQVDVAYRPNKALEALYVDKTFDVGGIKLTFTYPEFKRIMLIYGDALDFAQGIYYQFFHEKDLADLEISIDETSTPTTPAQHFFMANELTRRGVQFATLAPRFVGEFQKGVDYMGDLAEFEKQFVVHARIAEHFGYKISVHSGSDKFSVFPIVGRLTKGRVHVKTAGTNWLEAMRVVAMRDPKLYRGVHKYALTRFADAKKFYHVTTDLNRIPDVDALTDGQLESLFEQDDARQLIHITYGFILNEKNADGSYTFRDQLYSLWRRERDAYEKRIFHHIGRHVQLLRSEL